MVLVNGVEWVGQQIVLHKSTIKILNIGTCMSEQTV